MTRGSRILLASAALALATGCGADLGQDELMSSTGPKLAYAQYEVLFTNPTCAEYAYDEPVVSVSGEILHAKPKDVFCTKADAELSGARADSPQHRLTEWIADPSTEEIFFAALSFSNGVLLDAMCDAVEQRSVKISFVLDANTSLSKANKLLSCVPASGDPADAPELLLGGHSGNIRLQHNKLFVANPQHETMRIAFGSGNMSSGVVLHHENWHFITLSEQTYFAQAHRCLMAGLTEHGDSKSNFSSFIDSCRRSIDAREESDIKAFFVPGGGGQATQVILNHVAAADTIDIAAHRFTHSTHVKRLRQRLESSDPPPIRMVADDDLHWVGQGEQTGGNEAFEHAHVSSLEAVGLDVRYMETNHAAHLLHHNKFYLFGMAGTQPDAVFSGAGNFTKSAFRDNHENFYFVTIPHVVERFRQQFDYLHGALATPPGDLPATNILPPL